MQIYRAISKSDWITQKFGLENTAPSVLPLYQSLGLKGHNGWDFACFNCSISMFSGDKANKCDLVYFDIADCYGKVVEVSKDDKLGWGVRIITDNKDGIFKHEFWHFREIYCTLGQVVSPGDLLGACGMTGYATGPHLHRGMKPLAKNADGSYYNINQNNGYFGCVDLAPYYKDAFIGDLMTNLQMQVTILQKMVNLLKDFLKGRNNQI